MKENNEYGLNYLFPKNVIPTCSLLLFLFIFKNHLLIRILIYKFILYYSTRRQITETKKTKSSLTQKRSPVKRIFATITSLLVAFNHNLLLYYHLKHFITICNILSLNLKSFIPVSFILSLLIRFYCYIAFYHYS